MGTHIAYLTGMGYDSKVWQMTALKTQPISWTHVDIVQRGGGLMPLSTSSLSIALQWAKIWTTVCVLAQNIARMILLLLWMAVNNCCNCVLKYGAGGDRKTTCGKGKGGRAGGWVGGRGGVAFRISCLVTETFISTRRQRANSTVRRHLSQFSCPWSPK